MIELGGFIDIHSHILPSVDDGATDLEETKSMLRIAYEQGIRAIIATPHYYVHRNNPAPSLLQERLEQVKEEVQKLDPTFQLYLGNEIYYEDGCIEALKQKKAITMANSRYVLIEFSPSIAYQKLYQAMQEVIRNGYLPIIAHIERYEALRKNQDGIRELTELGCYLQVNANSLIGGIFDSESSFLRKLMKQHLVHFIATDCHNTTTRRPQFLDTMKKLSKVMEGQEIQQILCGNPSKIIDNKVL